MNLKSSVWGQRLPLVVLTLSFVVLGVRESSIDSKSERPIECGHHCAVHIAELLGVPCRLDDAYKSLRTTHPDGLSLGQIKDFLEKQLLVKSKAGKVPIDTLLASSQPAIVYVTNPSHFVVLSKSATNSVVIFDGAGDRRVIQPKELRARYGGIAMFCWRDEQNRFKDNSGPRIDFESLVVDLPNLENGYDVHQCLYRFRNSGSQPLELKKVLPGCKCLKESYPRKPIAPGDSGLIELAFAIDAQTKSKFQHEILVESNCEVTPQIVLRICGNKKKGLKVYARGLRTVSAYAGQASCSRFIRLEQEILNDRPAEIAFVRATHEGISAHAVSEIDRINDIGAKGTNISVLSPNRSFVFRVDFDLELLAELVDSQLPLKGTIEFRSDLIGSEKVQVPYQIEIRSGVAAYPSVVSAPYKVSFLSKSGQRFRVLNSPGSVRYQPMQTPDDFHKSLSATYDLKQPPPRFDFLLETEDGTQFTLPVKFR